VASIKNKILESPTILQLIKHLLVGSSAFIIHFVCLTILVSNNILNSVLANSVGFFAAFSYGYLIQRNWVFKQQASTKNNLLKYLISQLIFSFSANQGLFVLFSSFTMLNYQIICFICCSIVASLTFIMNKFWVFKA
jgi:putative flippase GtrA